MTTLWLALGLTLIPPGPGSEATPPGRRHSLTIPTDLFRDDFSRFPPGWLTRPVGQLNGAIQEYHYLPHRGVPLGPWANAICHLDAWAVGEEEGRSYLEQHTINTEARLMSPLFVAGDPEWQDATIEA